MKRNLILGIDLGGTNTEIGLVSPNGEIISRTLIKTSDYPTADEFVEAVYTKFGEMERSLSVDAELLGVGIGAPCVNSLTGSIDGSTELKWPSPVPIRTMLHDRFGVRVEVTNDANVAALGEMKFGEARNSANFIVITLGTGIGAGVVCDGHLLNGSRGFAGELGHILAVDNSDRECGCGRKGCLQTYCSASGIVTTARQFIDFSKGSTSLAAIPENEITSQRICEEAEKGDFVARQVFEFTGEILGRMCAQYSAFTDPDMIIISGGVANGWKWLEKSVKRAFKAYSLHLNRDRVTICRSSFGPGESAVLGAAALIV
ncbi:MAG: ROK family protein [Muribaculum sp.]|nr:ROK family protein [Muribaculum sp.]